MIYFAIVLCENVHKVLEMDGWTWDDVYRFYKRKEECAISRYPGLYLLVHVPTLKCAVGDPHKDDTGGYTDAFRKLWKHYGPLHGQYFGILIPNKK